MGGRAGLCGVLVLVRVAVVWGVRSWGGVVVVAGRVGSSVGRVVVGRRPRSCRVVVVARVAVVVSGRRRCGV